MLSLNLEIIVIAKMKVIYAIYFVKESNNLVCIQKWIVVHPYYFYRR